MKCRLYVEAPESGSAVGGTTKNRPGIARKERLKAEEKEGDVPAREISPRIKAAPKMPNIVVVVRNNSHSRYL
jgi:hypothetical protein